MRRHADRSPEGRSLAVRVAEATPVEPDSPGFSGRGTAPPRPGPTPFAFEVRGIWPRRAERPGREPSPWIMIALAALIVLIATIGIVAWINRPDFRGIGDLRVDVLIEGAWRSGKEAVIAD